MSVDVKTVKRIAKLARIALKDENAEEMKSELNAILGFVEQLDEVNVDGVEPITSVINAKMKMRNDEVNDGNIPQDIIKNAPQSEDQFFIVPKVVE